MKVLILCVCILIFASFSSAVVKQQLKSALKVESAKEDCMNQCNMSADDFFTDEDIINDRYEESENEEKSRKNGCFIECRLQQHGVMQGRELIETNMLAMINEEFKDQEIRIVIREILRECMKGVENITEVYKKCLSLYACALKTMHEIVEQAAHEENSTEEDH
ncbi:Obp12 [Eciton burchellii]|nr:Obp12 [Eciton burchellii]